MKKVPFFLFIQILAVIGIALAVFLLWEQFFHPSFQPCSINSTINCDAIISGDVSKTFGVPTPLFGLIGYIVILIAATLQNKKLVLSMALFGLVFCLWIAYKELFQLHVICPVCILCQVDMILVFTFSLLLLKNKTDN